MADYPGLLRVVSWVLNGLDVVAQNAVVSRQGVSQPVAGAQLPVFSALLDGTAAVTAWHRLGPATALHAASLVPRPVLAPMRLGRYGPARRVRLTTSSG